ASPDKSLTIRHAKSPALAENLLAQTSMFTNTRNQWDGGGAYVLLELNDDDFSASDISCPLICSINVLILERSQ
ncbi:hypothetical protein, partial [Agrobacterium vitis]|uniref:hypothetical protein n=1 Tax=Agrobacterium vitis TaxID=373 RepID=UPI001AEDC2CC